MKANTTTLRILLLVIVLSVVTGCKSWIKKCDTLPSGGSTVVIDKSPVSDEKLDETEKQIELDARLLKLCLVPLPDPGFSPSANSVELSNAKKNETGLYYDCAYRHNALVKFLADKLGIVAAEVEAKKK